MAIVAGTNASSADKEQEFGLISFAMGSVTGARSFKVDKLGRLTGIHFPQVWMPGENLAVCRKAAVNYSLPAGYVVMNYMPRDIVNQDRTTREFIMYDGHRIPERAGEQLLSSGQNISVPVMHSGVSPAIAAGKPTKDHSLASCEHGFYAYYDGSDDYHKPSLVSGVVEGYGESVIGTRGFRCMKAKIIALTVSPDLAKPVAELVHRNYKDVPQFVTFEQMVKAFPASGAGMEPAPETDEDFWTRTL